MAGASDDHNRITANICGELRERLRGKPCEPFATDMKVRIRQANDTFYYPDVTVACDPADNAKYFRERPSVIFEVISPDTGRTDRREKAYAYWRIPSVELYLLVEQEQQRITVLRRSESDWQAETLEGASAVLKLDCLGVEIPFERIYERTAISKPSA
jgi:Uma2 family endonuclease